MSERRAPLASLDDDRWNDLLRAFGDLSRDFQSFKDRDFQTFKAELMAEQLTYWHATAEALRVLSDWWARETDEERQERAERQARLDAQLVAIHDFERGSQLDRQHIRTVLLVLVLTQVVISIVVAVLVAAHL